MSAQNRRDDICHTACGSGSSADVALPSAAVRLVWLSCLGTTFPSSADAVPLCLCFMFACLTRLVPSCHGRGTLYVYLRGRPPPKSLPRFPASRSRERRHGDHNPFRENGPVCAGFSRHCCAHNLGILVSRRLSQNELRQKRFS